MNIMPAMTALITRFNIGAVQCCPQYLDGDSYSGSYIFLVWQHNRIITYTVAGTQYHAEGFY